MEEFDWKWLNEVEVQKQRYQVEVPNEYSALEKEVK
jgi:hypothetical protein